MTSTAPAETPEQIVAREVEEVDAIHSQILVALRDGRAAVWKLAEGFYEFHERFGWKALGYDSLNEYLADPEIGLGQTQYYRLVDQWRMLVVYRKLDRERVETLDYSKVDIVMPWLKSGAAGIEDVISDVETLGFRDLREKYPSQARAIPGAGKSTKALVDDDPADAPPDDSDQLENEPVRADEVAGPEPEGEEVTDAEVVDGEVLDAEAPPHVQADAAALAVLQALPWDDIRTTLSSGAAHPRIDRAVLEALDAWHQAHGGR